MLSLFYKFITLSFKQIIGCENAKGVKFATISIFCAFSFRFFSVFYINQTDLSMVLK